MDTLGYLTLEGLLACENEPARYCRACFTGNYPIAVDPSAEKLAMEKLHTVAPPLGP